MEKHTPYFTVIIPVYQTENVLRRAVESVLKQSFKDFELILIDDCSPDGCPALCDLLAAEDSRVQVVHKAANEGLGAARNTGLDHADGSWVLFLDSDDWIEPHTLETLAVQCQKMQPDLLVFGLTQDYENKTGKVYRQKEAVPPQICVENKQDIVRLIADLDAGRCFSYAWNKCYRRSFLEAHRFRFSDIRLMEDFFFNIMVFPAADRIAALPDSLYHYVRPVRTTLATSYYDGFFELCKMRYRKQEALANENGLLKDDCMQSFRDCFIKHILSVLVRNSSQKAALSFSERRQKAQLVLNDSLVQEVLAASHSEVPALSLLEKVFRHRMVLTSLLIAKLYLKKQTLFV